MSFTFSKNDLSDFSGFGQNFRHLGFFENCFVLCLVFWRQTFTWTNKSPFPYWYLEFLLPFNLRILPDWIPSSSLILTFPFIASISLESQELLQQNWCINHSVNSLSSRFKNSCSILQLQQSNLLEYCFLAHRFLY
jgi:hypothetical protein